MSSIVCGCGRQVETQPDWAGQWITCPGCNGALYAPFPGAKPSEPIVPVAEATRICPLCAETIPVADPTCKFCGGGAARAPRARPRPALVPADPGSGTAALIVSILGIVLCGLLFPFAWILGSNYEAECGRLGIAPSAAGKAGKIIGIIGTAFLVLVVVICILAGVSG